MTTLQHLAERLEMNRQARCEQIIECCRLLAEARLQFKKADEFLAWVVERYPLCVHGARAAVRMGQQLDVLRDVLSRSKRESVLHIWRHEWPADQRKMPKKAKQPKEAPREYKPRIEPSEASKRVEAMLREGADFATIAAEIPYKRNHVQKLVRDAMQRIEIETRVRAEMAAQAREAPKPPPAPPPAEPDLSQLTDKGRLTVEKALAAMRARQERQFEVRVYWAVQEEIEKRQAKLNERFGDRLRQAEEVLNAHKGLFTADEFKIILASVHPDAANSVSQERRAQAFALLRAKQHVLTKPEAPVRFAHEMNTAA